MPLGHSPPTVKGSLRPIRRCVNQGVCGFLAGHGWAMGGTDRQNSEAPVTTITLIRHAPPLTEGRLAGRRDVAADCGDRAAFARLRLRLPQDTQTLCSPARRCLQTAATLGLAAVPDDALWEQDYGAWEGLLYEELPDIGRCDPTTLAAHRPRNGESFDDMAARVLPLLKALSQDTVIVAHAGTVRAGLSLVVGAAALCFSVAPLSMTVLNRAGEDWAVVCANVMA